MNDISNKASYQLSDWTTWRIGGVIHELYQPTSTAELAAIVKKYTHSARPLSVIGYGSNLLIDDHTLEGGVIVLKKNFAQYVFEEHDILRVEAGMACPKLARLTYNLGFNNLAFLAGIPGSIGGAAKMNAGAHGQALMDSVIRLELMDKQGVLHLFERSQFQAVYRKTFLPFPGLITRIWIKMSTTGELSLAEVLDYRSKTQPLAAWSCGSVFKNPDPKVSAGWLIEQVGLKGFVFGNLEISSKHANFMLNRGGASSEDVLALTKLIQQRVYLLTGFILEPEYQRLGPCFYD